MTRFLAGLVCGALIGGAAWYGQRVGYAQAKVDIAETAALAGALRPVGNPSSCDERRPREIWAEQREPTPRKLRRPDPDAPWEPIPAQWITPKERAELVKKMEARAKEQGGTKG